MRILVCGGRDFTDHVRVFAALDRLHAKHPITVLIHGAAPGVDRLASRWAKWRGIEVEPYPADWDKHRTAAGPIRNQRMLDHSNPDAVVAFPGGVGTADMVTRAVKAGLGSRIWFPYGERAIQTKKDPRRPWRPSGGR